MKTSRIKRYAIMVLLCTLAFACKENVETYDPPILHFEQKDLIYTVKVGKELVIEPQIENDIDSRYAWTTSDGKVLSSKKVLRYTWDESDEIYLNFKVVTEYGSAEEEIMVVVAALAPPVVSIPLPEDGYFIMKKGEEKMLEPVVANGEEATFEWKVDGKVAGKEKALKFKAEQVGKHSLHFTARNEDGQDEMEFVIDVKEISDLPFSWKFKEEYHISKGRELYICPMDIENAFEAEYTWKVEGEEKQKSKEAGFIFKADKEGEFQLSITMDNKYGKTTEKLTVTVCPEEGKYKRPAGKESKAEFNKVFEYLPAPGQFINESEPDKRIESMEEACNFAYNNMIQDFYISLGAFGGYIVIGFDHSIENDGDYNIQISGNSFDGSSEPGIVYVMQDENGNGKPDDNWYELKGSEYGKEGTIQDYAITYYRPEQSGMDVQWTDNQGNRGVVEYNSFHTQPSYYPRWVKENSYTLRGTRLKSRTEKRGEIWYNGSYDWGYADNFSAVDRLTGKVKTNANHFKISNAVTHDGKEADLKYIDFVKIQTGVNDNAGIVGEVSTEVLLVQDYNLLKNQ